MKDKLSDKIRSSKICGCHFTGNFFLIFIQFYIQFLHLPISALYPHFSVLSPFQRFIPISAFYPHFSVLSPFQRFIPISAFYHHFSVLSPFQRFIPISAFYPHFSVLSPFQRFIPISAFYPHFSFRFQFPFPRFSFSVLSLPRAELVLERWAELVSGPTCLLSGPHSF